MDELQKLMNSITEWSTNQFGDDQTHQAIVKKLEEEVAELDVATSLDLTAMKIEELADCFHLLLDYSKRMGITAEDLVKITSAKLARNKIREWNKPNSDGVIKHVEEDRYNSMDREIIEDILCDLIRDCMYKLADSGEYQIDLNYAIVSLISLAHRIQDGLVSNYDVVSAICGNRVESLGDMYKFADLVLSNDLMEIYRRHRGDPYAKGN